MGQPVVHFEIGCRDSGKTQEFYAKLFDWQIQQAGPAAMIETGGKGGINNPVLWAGPFALVQVSLGWFRSRLGSGDARRGPGFQQVAAGRWQAVPAALAHGARGGDGRSGWCW